MASLIHSMDVSRTPFLFRALAFILRLMSHLVTTLIFLLICCDVISGLGKSCDSSVTSPYALHLGPGCCRATTSAFSVFFSFPSSFFYTF